MSFAIKADKISKQYRLGVLTSKSLAKDFNILMSKILKKENPYLKIGSTNNRNSDNGSGLVWALKNVSFEIKKGEVTGIIGRNGAGKSTLLKILSRVTSHTTGTVKIKGRVASLLEVGTGFHAELTGRENVYLNGSIMGMTKSEITKRFDEIVEFSGIGNYIDTPVKRYSSGMYLRLAFAVAAHLEPEILIVDEVLAVGDIEFQKKCIGKMQDVSSKEGRTVLFVSHNMGAINSLCDTAILLENGELKNTGETEKIISEYMSDSENQTASREFSEGKTEIHFTKIQIKPEKEILPSSEIDVRYPFAITFSIHAKKNIPGLSTAFSIYTKTGAKVFYSSARLENIDPEYFKKESINAEVNVPAMFLSPGNYYISSALQLENIELFDYRENVLQFEIIESGSFLSKFKGKDIGSVLVNLDWKNPEENFNQKK